MDEICRKYKVYAMLSTQRWTSVDELASLSRRKQGFESPRERQKINDLGELLAYRRSGPTITNKQTDCICRGISTMSDGRLTLFFDALHDADAGVWVATSAEGRITTEAPSRDDLIERRKVIVLVFLESRLGHAPRDVSIIINWQELRTVEQTELMVA